MRLPFIAGLVFTSSVSLATPAISASTPHWVAAWASSPTAVSGPKLPGVTVRQVIRLSAGGRLVRIKVSNEVGDSPLVISDVQLAKAGAEGGAIDPSTNHPVTFGGEQGATVAAGTAVVSDPVSFPQDAKAPLAVSIFVKAAPERYDLHIFAPGTAFLAAGDTTSAARLDAPQTLPARLLVSEVETAPKAGATIAVFGDSIADGLGSDQDGGGRISSLLAISLRARYADIGVVDEGICGNSFTGEGPRDWWGISALARTDRDLLSLPNLRTVVLIEGINDVMHGEAPAKVIAAMTEFHARLHRRGIRVVVATLTPIQGFFAYSPAVEASREAVNGWIRGGSVFEGVIDSDQLLRDPNAPSRLLARYDHGDHVHPNEAGYRRIAQAVDLDLIARDQISRR